MTILFRHMKGRAKNAGLKRGSALLIVLGFLSFMMVSAVSFAIYMRIERQASSNYRHATTARHLLNSALYRAMDEIDGELRIKKLKSNPPRLGTEPKQYPELDWEGKTPVPAERPVKFPEWPGHVKPSAVVNESGNLQEARVLSMEALSFIPAVFANDIRRYAVTNQADWVHPDDKINGKPPYFFGTKWRKLSMPVNSIVRGENAYEEAVVGRYAYLCVNVSDMLDVNVCKAGLRDAVTNRVSIGHLFGPNAQTQREAFDDYVKNTGIRFETLQDFYACMFQKDDPTFGSPYHDYLTDRGSSDPDQVFNEAANHVLITDALAKAQPASANALNVTDSKYRNNMALAANDFAKRLSSISTLVNGGASNAELFYKCMLMDYLDEDCQPYFEPGVCPLYRPSVEMVPMVYQMTIAGNNISLTPTVSSTPIGGGASPSMLYKLKLSDSKTMIPLSIQCMFPFKNWAERKTKDSTAFDFTLEPRAFLVLVRNATANIKTRDQTLINPKGTTAPGADLFCKLDLKAIPPLTSPLPSDENQLIKANTALFTVPDHSIDVYEKAADGTITWKNGFSANMYVRIALVVFVAVKQKNKIVDLVPGYCNLLQAEPATLDTAVTDSKFDRLFFQTTSFIISDPFTSPPVQNFEWTSLEVADPRFNHKAGNWIVAKETDSKTDIDKTYARKMVGKEGRDGDVYMTVANAGRLFSPGEFGFLPRAVPKLVVSVPNSVELASINNENKTEDKEYMFRTVRLYDHTSEYPNDKIYDNFIAQNDDGTVPGARVNPLSDLPQVLCAAVCGTPVDYWIAAQDPVADKQMMMKNTFDYSSPKPTMIGNDDWGKFTNAWFQCLLNVRKTTDINRSWKSGLPDYYGNENYFSWYAADAGEQTALFEKQKVAKILTGANIPPFNKPLHEIDRKMLYSFSLDSFSDRQQLFLYILRAEVTSSPGSGGKSLAGGRAVALVWRDPYPEGYDKESDNWFRKGQGNEYWYHYNPIRVSPWFQVSRKKNNAYLEENDLDGDPFLEDNPSSDYRRFDGYHQHRILYFKQLDE